MDIPVTEARARLSELMRRAEAGDEIVLTRHGNPAAWIVPATSPYHERARRVLIASTHRSGDNGYAHGQESGKMYARASD